MSTDARRGRRQDGAGVARAEATASTAAAPAQTNSRRRRREEDVVDEDVQFVRSNHTVVDLTDSPGPSGAAADDDNDVVIVGERMERRRRIFSPTTRQPVAVVNALTVYMGTHGTRGRQSRHHILVSTDGPSFGEHDERLLQNPALAVRDASGAGPSNAVAAPHGVSQPSLPPANVPPNVARMLAEAPPSPQKPGFKCPICLESMEKMVSTPCGHVFCDGCLSEALKARKQCPKCRKSCSTRQVHRIFLE